MTAAQTQSAEDVNLLKTCSWRFFDEWWNHVWMNDDEWKDLPWMMTNIMKPQNASTWWFRHDQNRLDLDDRFDFRFKSNSIDELDLDAVRWWFGEFILNVSLFEQQTLHDIISNFSQHIQTSLQCQSRCSVDSNYYRPIAKLQPRCATQNNYFDADDTMDL